MAAGQSVQVDAFPALNLRASHAVHAVAPVALFVRSPAPHGKHASSCAVGAYLPASHFSHDASL